MGAGIRLVCDALDLLEYQGKQFLAGHGVAVPRGRVATTAEEAVEAAATVGYPAAVKAQVRVGGRGKAGGIRVAADETALRDAAEAILGMDISGHTVRSVWVEEGCEIRGEIYVSFTLDRTARTHLCLLSAQGGVDIEGLAADRPEAIARHHIDPLDGITEADCSRLLDQAGIDPEARDRVAGLLPVLYAAYTDGDADLVEVNPLVVTTAGAVVALDAKVTLDDNAAYRHPEWAEWSGTEDLDERERLAREKHLNYIGLDGSVGVIGNGAGLVMSTLDVVHQVGGSAANFLDVGGGAGADLITAALEVVNSDPKVRAIFVNIFGGITRCDDVARGIIEALGRVDLRSPIVVRLDGTNAAEGRALLEAHESERMVSRPTMLDAARRAVQLAAAPA